MGNVKKRKVTAEYREHLRQVAIVQWRRRNDSGLEAIASVADAVMDEMERMFRERTPTEAPPLT